MALRDSPVGLAAYILEKFSAWTDKKWIDLQDGGITKKYTLIDLLDNIMIYWTSGCITTSVRLYRESFNEEQNAMYTYVLKFCMCKIIMYINQIMKKFSLQDTNKGSNSYCFI